MDGSSRLDSVSEAAANEGGLADGLLAGDRDVVQTVSGWICRTIRFVPWRQKLDAQDILQETLTAVLINLQAKRYKGEGFRAYVESICKNKCADVLRRSTPTHVELNDDHLEVADPAVSAEEAVLHVERVQLALRVMHEIPEGCRRMLVEIYLRGKNAAQIAQELGIRHGAARKRLHDCMKKVREVRAQLTNEK